MCNLCPVCHLEEGNEDQFDGGYKPSEPRPEPKFVYVPDENGGHLEPNPKLSEKLIKDENIKKND